jgi:L-lactate dehydrogenase complex protein LldE
MFHNSALHNEYKQVQKYFYELSDFLVNIMNVSDVGASLEGTAAYLDNCSALRELGVQTPPRTLLSKVRGLNVVDIADADMCCGWGGTFANKFEDIAVKLAEKKVDSILEAGANIVISSDMGCLMHLEGFIKKNNIDLKVLHLADVLANND